MADDPSVEIQSGAHPYAKMPPWHLNPLIKLRQGVVSKEP